MNNKYHYILSLLALITISLSYLWQMPILSYISIAIVLGMMLMESAVQDFYLLLSIAVPMNGFKLSGIGLSFIFLTISIIKLLMKGQRNLTLSPILTIMGFIVIFLTFIHEASYVTIGTTINSVILITYFIVLLTYLPVQKLNIRYCTLLFFTSLIITQIFAILVTGNLAELGDASNIFRLGQKSEEFESYDIFGGSMGFPVRTVLLICMSISFFVGKYSKIIKTSLAGIVVILVIITFLTISKVYLLGLGTLVVSLFFVAKSSKARLNIIGYLILMLVLGFVLLPQLPYDVDDIVDAFIFRIGDSRDAEALTTHRSVIYADVITYLTNNFSCLFFGAGKEAYPEIGKMESLAFYMEAHNIILDCIMAYGIVGLALIIALCHSVIVRVRIMNRKYQLSMLGALPLICWFMMSQTNSAFSVFHTYLWLPFLVLFMIMNKDILDNKLKTNE